MKKILILILVLGALGAGGWALKSKLSKPARAEAVSVKVSEAPIESTVDATGSISPYHRVEIKAAIGGRIEKLLVKEGDRVSQGQIIAWMSSTDRAAILDAARAQGADQLKKWEDTYKATPIIAPLPGIIILKNVVEGETVTSSSVIYAMSDVLIVLAQVDESDIGRIRVGMPASITLDSYPDKKDEAKVFDILYEGRNVSNVIQYSVKLRFDKVPPHFRSQMTANISFILSRKDKALLVPASAVRERDGVKQVLVPGDGPGGKDVWKEVKTGVENDASVEIVSGLAAGDTVLIRQGRYVPQSAVASSPLAMGGSRPGATSGQAPRSRSGSSSGGSR
ncbi:MAG: efflux RND transporter periplasmic adaptor subunit [Elusimicrobia bacterium]|nr:efflux RND transporter periplasmic adaptor subunit [Elusimicrobiota bacterium]